LGKKRSPKPPWQEANFRLRPAADCRHQNQIRKKVLTVTDTLDHRIAIKTQRVAVLQFTDTLDHRY